FQRCGLLPARPPRRLPDRVHALCVPRAPRVGDDGLARAERVRGGADARDMGRGDRSGSILQSEPEPAFPGLPDRVRMISDPRPRVQRGLQPTALAVLAALALVSASLGAQRKPAAKAPPAAAPKAAPKTEQKVPFHVGEKLEYDVGWSSYITAGNATVT